MQERQVPRSHRHGNAVIEQFIICNLIPAVDRPTNIPPRDQIEIRSRAMAGKLFELTKLFLCIRRRRGTSRRAV